MTPTGSRHASPAGGIQCFFSNTATSDQANMAPPERVSTAVSAAGGDTPPSSPLFHAGPTAVSSTLPEVVPNMCPMRANASLPGDGLQDLRLQLAAIPTKQDMEGYIKRLKSTYKSEIQDLPTNLLQFSYQVQHLERDIALVSTHLAVQDHVVEQHTQQICLLFTIAKDHEKRKRRNHLRIRSILESLILTSYLR